MAYVYAMLAGVFGVLQGGINRFIAQDWGFTSALLFNGIVFLVFNLLFYFFVRVSPQWFPDSYHIQGQWDQLRWWWVLPGICGFLLVGALAISMTQVGAVETIIFCVAAQVVASGLWDYFVEQKELSFMRITGALITFAGVFLSSRG